jgi:hypothetical protein
MKNGVKGLLASLSVIALCSAASAANAAYLSTSLEPSGELKFFAGAANKDVASFVGNVGAQNSGPTVDVNTIGNVDTDAGYGAIKPVSGATLTDVTFTPQNGAQFGSFFFRGQLLNDGDVTLKVNDALGDPTQTFTFDNLKANANFGPLGIVLDLAFPNDFSAIKTVELISAGFKELKQIDFDQGPLSAVPLPASLYLFAASLMGLGASRAFSKRKARRANA